MVKYRKLTSSGDYTFGANQSFYTGTLAVSQNIKTRLSLLQHEWWEDLNQGFPLFQNVLGQPGKPQNIQAIDLLVKDVISNTQDVISIKDFKSTYENRNYSLQCAVSTKYGDATVEVTF